MQRFIIKRCDGRYDIETLEDKVNSYLEEGYTVASVEMVPSQSTSVYTTIAVVVDKKEETEGKE